MPQLCQCLLWLLALILGVCMQDKGPIIEELEEAMQRLHEERASALLERRIADNADEMAEIEVAVNAAKAALAKGGGTASAMAAASAASARDGRNNTAPQLDEFGRDVNLQKRLESKRRAQARERRAKMTAERRMNLIKNSNGDSARTVVSSLRISLRVVQCKVLVCHCNKLGLSTLRKNELYVG